VRGRLFAKASANVCFDPLPPPVLIAVDVAAVASVFTAGFRVVAAYT
jgi:hypothetical protein